MLGIVGAVLGGFLFSAVGATGITGFNLYSTALFAADENSSPNVLTREQYHAGKRLYDTMWNNFMEKKISLDEWNNFKNPMAGLTGQLVRHEVAATFDFA